MNNTLTKFLLSAGLVAGIAMPATAQVAWIDGDTGSAFESPVGSGNIPDGWSTFGSLGAVNTDTVANGGQVNEGNQSVFVSGGSQGISRPVTFGDTGEFHWMFYDDMALSKNIRVGLTRPGDTAPRFGAIAVDGSVSETHYNAHIGFGFEATTVERSEGWRHMHLAWETVNDATQVEFYIDGVLGRTASHAGITAIEEEFIGAPFASETGAWVDTIPEPSTYGAIFGGLALLGAFVYRRRTAAKK